MELGTSVLEAFDLTKEFGDVRALDQVTLSVNRGQIVALLGHNGAGKSTFAQIAAGVVRPSAGRVTWTGRSSPAGIAIGYCSQDIAIYPRSTVKANLEFVRRLTATDPGAVDRVARSLGLETLLDRTAGRLSGGQKRRLHTALGLVAGPDLLLLDEPTAGADAETRERILQAVTMAAKHGVAVMYTTHYAPEVEQLNADVIVLRRGHIAAEGTVDEIAAMAGGEGVRVTVEGAPVGTLPPGWRRIDESSFFVTLDASSPPGSVLAKVSSMGCEVSQFERVRPTLDAALLRLSAGDETGEPLD